MDGILNDGLMDYGILNDGLMENWIDGENGTISAELYNHEN